MQNIIIVFIITILIIFIIFWYKRISRPQNKKHVIIRNIIETDVNKISAVSDELNNLKEYASLSSNIYIEGKGNAGINLPQWINISNKFKSLNTLPKQKIDYKDIIPKFKRIISMQKYCLIKNYCYGVYCNHNLQTIALVFKGTNNWRDWISNFHWISKFMPFILDYYDQTTLLVYNLSNILSASQDNYKNYKIISTGHSLGGGLAQHAAYASNKIKLVYAFDSSMVTGYYDIPKNIRKLNKQGLHIYRIYEQGEILAYFRVIWKTFYEISYIDPQIIEIRYNLLSKGNSIDQHKIKAFADKL